MGPLNFKIQGLSEVMEQSCSFGQINLCPDLRRDHSCEDRYFYTVLQHILPIACAVLEAPQDFYEFRMKCRHAGLQSRFLAFATNSSFHLILGLLGHLLDTGRMYTSVQYKFIEGNT